MAKVLVVDDALDVADSFAELLTLFGHEVRVAYGASEALVDMEVSVPEIVLADLNMPILDGCELARRIRERWGERVRLVAHTAYPRAAVAEQIADAGFDSYVSKSAQPLDLALALQGRPGLPDMRTAPHDRRKASRSASRQRRSGDAVAKASLGSRFAGSTG